MVWPVQVMVSAKTPQSISQICSMHPGVIWSLLHMVIICRIWDHFMW